MLITDVEQARLLVIRSRLRLELKIPEFAKGGTGAHTLRGCRNLGFNGRTRKQALDWINGLIE
jgi:hypothetical protein